MTLRTSGTGLMLLACFLSPRQSRADIVDVQWTGTFPVATGNPWTDINNWQPMVVPNNTAQTSYAVFCGGTSHEIAPTCGDNGFNATVNSVTVTGGAFVTGVGLGLSNTSDFTTGSLDVNGTNDTLLQTTVTFQSSVLNVTGNATFSNSQLDPEGGTMNVGGTLTLENGADIVLDGVIKLARSTRS